MVWPKGILKNSAGAAPAAALSNDDDAGFEGSEFSASEQGEFSTTNTNTQDESISDNRPVLSEKEDKDVFRAKGVVIVVLLLAAATAATLTYLFAAGAETKEFESDFKGYAAEVAVVTNKNAESIRTAYEQFSLTVTSEALTKGETFPMVTIPDLERRWKAMEPLSKTRALNYHCVIRSEEERIQFEKYSPEAAARSLEESQAVAGVTVNSSGVKDVGIYERVTHGERPNRTYTYERSETPLPLVANHQWYPAREDDGDWINRDLTRYFGKDLQLVERTGAPYLSDITYTNRLVPKRAQTDQPTSFYVAPVYGNHSDDAQVSGLLMGIVGWDVFFEDLFPEGIKGIYAIVRNDCNQSRTYLIDGPKPTLLEMDEGGEEPDWGDERSDLVDLHDPNFDSMKVEILIHAFQHPGNGLGLCSYKVDVYPTQALADEYSTSNPAVFTVFVLVIFAFTSGVFFLYDWMVGRRQDVVMHSANKTSAIVTSLFPSQFHDQLFEDAEKQQKKDTWGKKGVSFSPETAKAQADFPELVTAKPVADLFPHTTIMMADVKGFTAWSSTREPSQTFVLLETLYGAFDSIASKRKVFKVETVGDCYVAACGLPHKNKKHAITMARFASDCAVKMNQLVHRLELVLGPGTANLGIRIGLHSGPTIAGVLRGDKARFQLFGDTINTASRIETTGEVNRIHVSQSTADELTSAGKGHWVVPREDKVYAKGLGQIATYWLQSHRSGSTFGPATTCSDSQPSTEWELEEDQFAVVPRRKMTRSRTQQIDRLVEWNCATLLPMLEQVMASRHSKTETLKERSRVEAAELRVGSEGMVLDEVKSIITLPVYSGNELHKQCAEVPEAAKQQLKDYIGLLAENYRNNPFHNFEHASHVTMSVHKLMSRIVAPERPNLTCKDGDNSGENMDTAQLHDHTYGITSDPLTQFAIVLSALIHDVDHRGVPNGQLVKEDPALGDTYKNKSVAEQNSVDVAWNVLMDDKFKDLRACIYTDSSDLARFRQIIVNSVLATDIFDKELGDLRKARWNAAFKGTAMESSSRDVNRKATIVIEHIIQASDVSHTMQHWHVYQAWNEKLFHEMYLAYKDGRSAKHPKEGWYRGEIWFFDNYVIPLAKKLETCGVFGVSSDECLISAQLNRDEWEMKGEEIVAAMVEKYCAEETSEVIPKNCVDC